MGFDGLRVLVVLLLVSSSSPAASASMDTPAQQTGVVSWLRQWQKFRQAGNTKKGVSCTCANMTGVGETTSNILGRAHAEEHDHAQRHSQTANSTATYLHPPQSQLHPSAAV
jgi:hypothetical protein